MKMRDALREWPVNKAGATPKRLRTVSGSLRDASHGEEHLGLLGCEHVVSHARVQNEE